MRAGALLPLSLFVQTLRCCFSLGHLRRGAATPLRRPQCNDSLEQLRVRPSSSGEASSWPFSLQREALSESTLHRRRTSAAESFSPAPLLAVPGAFLARPLTRALNAFSQAEALKGHLRFSGKPLQVRPSGGSQRLFVRFCFDDTLPESTANRKKRKGALRCPVKTFLRECEDEERLEARKRKKKRGASGGSSGTALKSLPFGCSAEVSFTENTLSEMQGPSGGESAPERLRFVDIGANLVDSMFRGEYHGSVKHPPDLESVLQRAEAAGVERILLTSGCLQDLEENLELCRRFDPRGGRLFTTVGVHPTRCREFEEEGAFATPTLENEDARLWAQVLQKLKQSGLDLESFPARAQAHLKRMFQVYRQDKQTPLSDGGSRIVAVGEMGLDEDREHFCPLETQKKYFEMQMALTALTQLPMFLHMRKASTAFFEILAKHERLWREHGGVVHSFTGTAEEAQKVLEMRLFVGLNGCSLKTAENVDTVRSIPVDRLLLETDAPWCDLRPSHAGFDFIKGETGLHPQKQKPEKWAKDAQVKGRNEPANINQVAAVVHAITAPQMSRGEFTEIVFNNSLKLFRLPP